MSSCHNTARWRQSVLLSAAWLILSVAASCAFAQDKTPLTVFAAASLKETVEAISADWQTKTGTQVRLVFAGSSTLAKQIEEGAPADVFLSADQPWMDHLQKAGLILSETRIDLLGNRLVLIAANTGPQISEPLAQGFPLSRYLGDDRLAIADVAAVPAGRYGKAALESLGLWEGVRDQLAQTENVRAALLLVSRGEAPLGIVYETDALADKAVRIVGHFPPASHPPIRYPVAVTKQSAHPQAMAFLDALQDDNARRIFVAAGFSILSD